MKKITIAILMIAAAACWCAAALAADGGGEKTPGVTLSGKKMIQDGKEYLAVSINVENVTGLTAARVDIVYKTEFLELVNTLDDTDMDKPEVQNFLGPNILSLHNIKEKGVSEYAVSKRWINGAAPAGSDGSGAIGLLVFRIIKSEPTALAVRRKTLKLLKSKDEPIPEWSADFRIEGLTFDPMAQ